MTRVPNKRNPWYPVEFNTTSGLFISLSSLNLQLLIRIIRAYPWGNVVCCNRATNADCGNATITSHLFPGRGIIHWFNWRKPTRAFAGKCTHSVCGVSLFLRLSFFDGPKCECISLNFLEPFPFESVTRFFYKQLASHRLLDSLLKRLPVDAWWSYPIVEKSSIILLVCSCSCNGLLHTLWSVMNCTISTCLLLFSSIFLVCVLLLDSNSFESASPHVHLAFVRTDTAKSSGS